MKETRNKKVTDDGRFVSIRFTWHQSRNNLYAIKPKTHATSIV